MQLRNARFTSHGAHHSTKMPAKLFENLEEMFPRYYMHSALLQEKIPQNLPQNFHIFVVFFCGNFVVFLWGLMASKTP